jgi:Kef-type K+ transport system membrane component KefB
MNWTDVASNPPLVLGAILLAAALFGAAAEKAHIPWISGCIAAGVLAGPDVADVLPERVLTSLGDFLQASLAVIAFNIGNRLTPARLRKIGRSVVWLASAQLVAPFILVGGAALLLGIAWPAALVMAAVSPVTAPTTTYAVIRRLNASGPFVERALGILAINDAITILLFAVVSAISLSLLGTGFSTQNAVSALRHGAVREVLSLVAGGALAVLYLGVRTVLCDRRPGWQERVRAALYAVLLLAIGCAIAFDLSHLLTALTMGAVIAGASSDEEQAGVTTAMEDIEQPLYMIFFVLAGAHLPLTDVVRGGLLGAALVYVAARLVGKYAAVYLTASALGLDRPTRNYLGLCFPSQGGTALGLMLAFAGTPAFHDLPHAAQSIAQLAVSVVLLGVLVSETFGPIVIDYAIRRGTDDGKASVP